jgi:hypothetical protein
MGKIEETKRERFIRIAESRTQKILHTIRLLGNCSNPYVYEYTQKDVDKMFSAIETELKIAKAKFTGVDKEYRFKL